MWALYWLDIATRLWLQVHQYAELNDTQRGAFTCYITYQTYTALMTQLQYWLCVFIMSRGNLGWIYTLRLPECQGTLCLKQARYLKVKWLQRYLNHNHLVRKRTLKHLVKLLSLVKCSIIRLQTTWFYVRAPMQSIPVCSKFYLSIKEIYQKLKELVSFLFHQSQGIISSTNYYVLLFLTFWKTYQRQKAP